MPEGKSFSEPEAWYVCSTGSKTVTRENQRNLAVRTDIKILLKSCSFGDVPQSVGDDFGIAEQPRHGRGGHAHFVTHLSSLARVPAAVKQEVRHGLGGHAVRT